MLKCRTAFENGRREDTDSRDKKEVGQARKSRTAAAPSQRMDSANLRPKTTSPVRGREPARRTKSCPLAGGDGVCLVNSLLNFDKQFKIFTSWRPHSNSPLRGERVSWLCFSSTIFFPLNPHVNVLNLVFQKPLPLLGKGRMGSAV